MSPDDPDHGSFEERVRALAREVSRSVERMAQFDIDEIAEAIGVDPARARELADTAGRWLSHQAEGLGAEMPFWTPPSRAVPDDDPIVGAEPVVGVEPVVGGEPGIGAEPAVRAGPGRGRGPHPLDLPTADQGLALSALDSGRWTVEPGSNVLLTHGEGPGPSDAMGLVGELRARDWIAANGEVTLVGRSALGRWLSSAESH